MKRRRLKWSVLNLIRRFTQGRGHPISLWIKKTYDSKDIADANLIIIATNDAKVNQQVRDDARPEQWVNHTGDRRQSDFYNSFDFVHNEMTISVSSEGQSIQRTQAYGAKIKAYLETLEEDFHE
ncbi:NAD(P)-dependent oxidoreductase [Staphylococcus schleiferi]|uniref:NAD(P)-dependent oxidoreductase n=1 Tax=Staphylococcus schleiferi TaxID=1295 RepID=UPI00247FCF69|nr:NAD(P)-dependent oxidoreductase [Staphylococcus schleiferi]